MTEEEKYQESVKESQENAHDETIWGKPARDIITGINNNNGVRPVRAIWELVQNARDVVKVGTRAKILFTRKENELVFQHDGIPFTHKTIEALILQTSSKNQENKVEVGQYGTGFLTTHMFGLKFKLMAPILTSEEYNRYYAFELDIDRSPTNKDQMRENIKDQWKESQKWGKNMNETTITPIDHTTFIYQHEGLKARENAASAFKDAPDMTPYVMLLNPNVEQITYRDEVDRKEIVYYMRYSDSLKTEDFMDGTMFQNTIMVTETELDTQKKKEWAKTISFINSHEITIDGFPKVTVVLPVEMCNNGDSGVFRFSKTIPQIYIYLPLLGTEQWGLNFLFHSSLFTPDRDSRDSLKLVGNGQNNDDQAELNREIIKLGNKLIWQFIETKAGTLKDAKYLLQADFKTKQSSEELAAYYQELQEEWRQKFATLSIVDTADGLCKVNEIRILDEILCKACEEDSELLDAIYMLLGKKNVYKVSRKEDMLYWSQTINQWYKDEENPFTLTIKDLLEQLPQPIIEDCDLNWLHKICEYVVAIKQDGLFDEYAMIPNDNLKLQKKSPLKKTVRLDKVVRDALDVMEPETTDVFVHSQFYDLIQDSLYTYQDVKTSITNYLNNQNSAQSDALSTIESAKMHDMNLPHEEKRFNVSQYEQQKYSQEAVLSILKLHKALMAEDSEGHAANLYKLFLEFYGIEDDNTIERLDKCYDLVARPFYTALLYDCLFKFTLMERKSEMAVWIKQMVTLVYGYSDQRTHLSKYQVYPNQKNEYMYASWLMKQPDDVPDKVIDIYDAIMREAPKKSIKEELVSKEFTSVFQGDRLLDGISKCKDVEKEVAALGYNISRFKHKNHIIDIIKHLTSHSAEREKWAKLFSDIDREKGQLMFSTMEDQSKKDSIFTLIQIEDAEKLKRIAELAEAPNFDEILKLGREAIDQRKREDSDFEFKKDLGRYVEIILQKELNDVIGNNTLHIQDPVKNEQGGQDLILYVNEKPLYYIEVKSRWKSEMSVLMSTNQHRRSYEEKEHYALCTAEMLGYDMEKVRVHDYPPFEEIQGRITVLEEIGKLNDRLKDATENDDKKVHVAGGYQVLVSQDVIRDHGVSFESFLKHLTDMVRKEMRIA